MDVLQEGAGDIHQIVMFGVGLYSSFLIADKVTVSYKNHSDDIQYLRQNTHEVNIITAL